jgi:thiol-disulfide isomerase/thioredoxin
MKKSFIFVLAAAAGLAGIAIGIAAGRSNLIRVPRAVSIGKQVSATDGTATLRNVAAQKSDRMQVVRLASNPQPAPAFLARDIDGNVVSTADWQGKVVLLNFWATWCPPCREEIPELIDLQNRYKDRLHVIGISMDDPEEAGLVKKFAVRAGINYPIVMASREIIQEYGRASHFLRGEHGRESSTETCGVIPHFCLRDRSASPAGNAGRGEHRNFQGRRPNFFEERSSGNRTSRC